MSALLGPKSRRNHGHNPIDLQQSLNDAASGSLSIDTKQPTHEVTTGLNWSKFDLLILRAYRQSYRLNTPSAFTNSSNERILSRSGIGRSSPTMVRHNGGRRVSKDHLALAVRKDFNAAMINEPEVITAFLYSVHNQDKCFRMRFAPPIPK